MAFKKLNLLWLATALVAGIALGYLFNSGFCRISIGKRVDKEIALNQSLRAHLVDLTWWFHTYFVFIPSNQVPVSMVPQIHATIDSLGKAMGTYYGSALASAVAEYGKKQLAGLTSLHEAIEEGHKDQMVEVLKTLKADATAFAKTMNGVNSYIATRTFETMLHDYIDLFRQDFIGHKEKSDSVDILVNLVTQARAIADYIDEMTIKQFPQRF